MRGARTLAGTLALALVFAIAALGLYRALPQEITPTEDRGFFFAVASTPIGASLDYTDEQVRKVEAVLEPYRESGEIGTVLAIVGRGESNRAFVIARLSDWEFERADAVQSESRG